MPEIAIIEEKIVERILKTAYPEEYVVYDKPTTQWDEVTQTLSFQVNEDANDNWRLVWKDNKIIAFFEGTVKDVTSTVWNLFCSTEKACLLEIERLNLEFEDDERDLE